MLRYSDRTVTPAYFETAIKSKYSRDSETSQMLDLIVSGVYLDYSYIYGQSLGAPIDVIRGILVDATSCENSQSKLKKQLSKCLTRLSINIRIC